MAAIKGMISDAEREIEREIKELLIRGSGRHKILN